jgi:multiple sugar transport system substrate-binding protein
MRIARWPSRRGGKSRAGASRRWQVVMLGAVVVALAAAACGGSSSSSGSGGKTTITELDYFTSSGSNVAVNWYNSQFEKTHPGVTVKREVVPYANLITKVLQEASAGDLPNIVMLDNPNVPEVAATGQLKPLNGLPGFTTSGYVPGAISECTFQGKQYCYPIGTNTVGLFYNKAMFAAKHLSPPATWAQLQSDAKALTSGNTFGIAFDATSDEQSTWQLEPFFWSAGGNLNKVNTSAFSNSLQLWVNMVKDGSASKSVLQWGQDPDLTQQFLHKTAAMIEDGPWIFPELNAAGWKYNQQYGIVPIPTQAAGGTVVAPLGGETWNIGNSGSTQQQSMAWDWIKGMQTPSVMTHVTTLMYYLPTKPTVTAQYLKGGPEYTVFAKETETARSRTTQYGANYPKVSQALWTAIQSAITGTSTVGSALSQAQSTISSIPQVKGSS